MAQPVTSWVTTTPASKLRPPRVRHHELTRGALLDDVAIRDAEVLAITAPAGFGKSTFAIQWASRSGSPVAWLTCDESDCDALVLMAGLSAAIARCVPDYQPPIGVETLEEPAFSRTVLPRFEESIAAVPTPVTVVLDDVHHITKEPAERVLRHFVNALPQGSQVAVVGRSLRAVPVPLWRGQGRAVDIGVAELTFGADETAEALAMFTGHAVHANDVERVREASQGWPVAIFLMSQTGRSHDAMTSVDEFIEAEVLAPMPKRLRNFVLANAALGSVTVELATAATGQARSAHYLNEAITTVLLQHTPDGWFRFHPLLQDCAIALLERENPDLLRRTRSEAARWHCREGHMETAASLALAAGDPQILAEVIWPAARLLLLQGRTRTVITWLDTIGERTLLRVPELSLTAAWTFIAASDFGRVLRFVESAVRAAPDDWRLDIGEQRTAPELTMLLALTGYSLSGPQQAAAFAAEVVTTLRPDDPTQALATTVWGVNLSVLGDPRSLEVLERAAATAASAGIPSTEVEARAMVGLVLMGRQDDRSGHEWVEKAAAVFAFHDLAQMTSTSAVLAIADVARCAARDDRAELDGAVRTLKSVLPHVEDLFPWYRPLAGGVLALASVRLGEFAQFREYARWCEDSDPPAEALCRQWVTRARREYAAVSPLQHLSPAELRVWDLLRGRMTLSEIGDSLYLSRETVKSHTMSIYRKLGVASRREAQDLAESWS